MRQLILYSYCTWVTNTVCSLFSYFSIILFAAYSANGRISVDIFSQQFHTSSIKNLFHNCFWVNKIVQINSLGGAIVLFAAYSVYGGISCAFSHLISHPSPTLSHQILGAINSSHTFHTCHHHSVGCLFS